MIDTDDPIGDALVAAAASSLDALADHIGHPAMAALVLYRSEVVDLLRNAADSERHGRTVLDRADVDADGLREHWRHQKRRADALQAQTQRVVMALAKTIAAIHRMPHLIGVTLVGLGAEVTLPKEDADLMRLCAVEETMRQALGRRDIDPKLVEAARRLIERTEDEAGAK